MASFVASLPFQIVCQLVVPTGNPSAPVYPLNSYNQFNLNGVTEAPTTTSTPTPTQTETATFLTNGYIAYPDIGVAYKIYNESVLWKVARRRCIEENGSLAVIDSLEKFDRVSRQRKSKGVTHVGIHSLFDDDEWVSVKTGLPLKNIPWATGEPNGRSYCAMVKHETGGLGNFNCATALGDFICEIPIPDNHGVGERLLANAGVTNLPEGYVIFEQDKAAYKIYQEGSTWLRAKERCNEVGARLAVLDSIDKINHVNSMKTTTDTWIHVGFHKLEYTGWVTADNDLAATSIPWKKDNPDDAGSCVGISVSEDRLINYSCNWDGEHFVCEIPL